MDPTRSIPSRVRRVLGYLLSLIGAAIVAAVAIYFMLHIASLVDIAAILLGTFGVTVGLTFCSFGLFLAGSSLVTRF